MVARCFVPMLAATALLLGRGPACSQASASAPSASIAPLAHIDRNGVLILLRATLMALDQANQTGNYTVLRDLGSAEFGRANSAARLGDIFAPLRSAHVDLSGIAVLDPQLTQMPQLEAGGQLHMAGFFPSAPLQMKFDVAYAPDGERWRVSSLSVTFASATPTPASPPIDESKGVKSRKPAGYSIIRGPLR